MAGDWIKIEKATPRKREVLIIAADLSIPTDQAFGLCFRFWAWCDDNLAEGNAPSVTESLLDSLISHQGFAKSLINVGWLRVRNGSLEVPNFDRHLSQSAKNRGLTAERVAKHKRGKGNAKVTLESLPEKRREEHKDQSTRGREIPPVTLDVTKANCGQWGVASDCAEQWWLTCDARGWNDERGQPITNHLSHLKRFANSWRANESQRKSHGNDSRPNRPTVTRNVGTLDPNRPSLNATAVNAGQAGSPGGVEADGGQGLDFDGQGGW